MEITEIVKQLRKALSPEDIEFFREVYTKYEKISALWTEGEGSSSFPHPVHFREGMVVRNMLRKITDYSWTAHEYDARWEELTEKAIKE